MSGQEKGVLNMKTIYIPHWLDSMRSRIYELAICNDIYIPHWLDSMGKTTAVVELIQRIYIPHWLDSMFLAEVRTCART